MRSIRSKQKIKNVGHYIRRKEVKGMTVNFGDVMMIDFGKDKINSVQVGVRPGVERHREQIFSNLNSCSFDQ